MQRACHVDCYVKLAFDFSCLTQVMGFCFFHQLITGVLKLNTFEGVCLGL